MLYPVELGVHTAWARGPMAKRISCTNRPDAAREALRGAEVRGWRTRAGSLKWAGSLPVPSVHAEKIRMADASPYRSPQAEEVPSENVPTSGRGAASSEPQLTWRAVLAGCLVGSVISCTNMYIGLKIGWTFGASIIAAVLSFSFFALINRRLSILETNVAQTAGSAAGYMSSAAGLVAAIPALEMLGYKIEPIPLVCWSLSIAFLGVFFAVPLRRQMILVDKLQFPSGTATAETILAMYSDADEAMGKARVLLWSGLLAGLFTLGYHFVPQLESPPLHDWFPDGDCGLGVYDLARSVAGGGGVPSGAARGVVAIGWLSIGLGSAGAVGAASGLGTGCGDELQRWPPRLAVVAWRGADGERGFGERRAVVADVCRRDSRRGGRD
jgi:hypothetical protein